MNSDSIVLIVGVILGSSGVTSYLFTYLQYRATQRRTAREYIAKFILTEDFLHFTGTFNIISYLLHASIELKHEGGIEILNPQASHRSSKVKFTNYEQLRKIMKQVAVQQERSYL